MSDGSSAAALSIVTTMYYSAPYLEEFYRRICAVAERWTPDFELILVNDGSPDDSLESAIALFRRDPRVRVVDLARNFGHHRAIMTGLSYARGERVLLIDCDLEEPPELLDDFMCILDTSGADVVYGVQGARRGGWLEQVSGEFFYRMMNALSTHRVPRNLVTVRLMSRRYVRALVAHGDRELWLAGLWASTGFAQIPVAIVKGDKGSTTYNFRRKVANLVLAVTAFSAKPLVYVFYLGGLILLLASSGAAYIVLRWILGAAALAGWPSLIVAVWLFGGVSIFLVGLLGIYLAKVFVETKVWPHVIVRSVSGGAGDPMQ